MNESVTLTGNQIEIFQLLRLRSALSLEILGMKHSQGSVYAYIKKVYGFKGNKQKVYEQFSNAIEALKASQVS